MRLFIISGKSGTGKNELANHIKKYYDNKHINSIITEYSKYVKLMAREVLNWDGLALDKPRTYLQDMGSEYRRILGRDIFINRMQEDILIYEHHYDNVIISDARLINELKLMKEKYPKCYTFHLTSNRKNTLNEEEKKHVTETELDDYNDIDYKLDSSDLNKLYSEVDKILEELS